jgi:hypothetical protein
MQERSFEQKNAARWNQFDALLTAAEKGDKNVDLLMLPELLQEESNDLSLARHRMYGANMCEYLNNQVIRGFKIVHSSKEGMETPHLSLGDLFDSSTYHPFFFFTREYGLGQWCSF